MNDLDKCLTAIRDALSGIGEYLAPSVEGFHGTVQGVEVSGWSGGVTSTAEVVEALGLSNEVNLSDRYLNLAFVNMGEAITQLGNVRIRGARTGNDTMEVQLALSRALAALRGEVYVPPPDNKNV